MKRFGNLYEKICTIENIQLAHKHAKRGKTKYAEVQYVDNNLEACLLKIQEILLTETFNTSKYRIFSKIDNGKERIIYALPYFPDRIIHHCIMQVIEPIWVSTLIRDTYASIKNRGVHDGVRRIQEALKNNPKDTKYCLKLDITKYYPSISHELLKLVIRKKIKDPKLLKVLDNIIDSVDKGIPIGNYISQFFGNLFLSDIDHFAKESLRVKYYYRYCDDIVILAKTSKELHNIRKVLNVKIQECLLILKANWQVFPTNINGIDFLGYRFFGTHTLLRDRIAEKFKQKAIYFRKNKVDPKVQRSSMMSYCGWMQFANAHSLFNKYYGVIL